MNVDKSIPLDEHSLAEALAASFRISLTGCIVQTERGVRHAVRATDIPEPNGFSLTVHIGWKSIEVDFFPDTYAGELIRTMGKMVQTSSEQFVSLLRSFETSGYRINIKVNGADVSLMDGWPTLDWKKFDLKVRKLTDTSPDDPEKLRCEIQSITAACLALILTLLPVEEDVSVIQPLYESGLPEGAYSTVTVNRYERSPANRTACIAVHGFKCKVCGFDFGEAYGSFCQGFIEVHHKVPVSKMGGRYRLDPANDLIPLCANCHAAVHRVDPPLDPDELAKFLLEKASIIPKQA